MGSGCRVSSVCSHQSQIQNAAGQRWGHSGGRSLQQHGTLVPWGLCLAHTVPSPGACPSRICLLRDPRSPGVPGIPTHITLKLHLPWSLSLVPCALTDTAPGKTTFVLSVTPVTWESRWYHPMCCMERPRLSRHSHVAWGTCG